MAAPLVFDFWSTPAADAEGAAGAGAAGAGAGASGAGAGAAAGAVPGVEAAVVPGSSAATPTAAGVAGAAAQSAKAGTAATKAGAKAGTVKAGAKAGKSGARAEASSARAGVGAVGRSAPKRSAAAAAARKIAVDGKKLSAGGRECLPRSGGRGERGLEVCLCTIADPPHASPTHSLHRCYCPLSLPFLPLQLPSRRVCCQRPAFCPRPHLPLLHCRPSRLPSSLAASKLESMSSEASVASQAATTFECIAASAPHASPSALQPAVRESSEASIASPDVIALRTRSLRCFHCLILAASESESMSSEASFASQASSDDDSSDQSVEAEDDEDAGPAVSEPSAIEDEEEGGGGGRGRGRGRGRGGAAAGRGGRGRGAGGGVVSAAAAATMSAMRTAAAGASLAALAAGPTWLTEAEAAGGRCTAPAARFRSVDLAASTGGPALLVTINKPYNERVSSQRPGGHGSLGCGSSFLKYDI